MIELKTLWRITGIAVMLLTLAGPSAAHATRKKSIWGPVEINGVSQFPTYADLGVGIWQTSIGWNKVAPTRPANPSDPADPAYQWPAYIDRAISEGARYGIRVSLIVSRSPAWANGGRSSEWAPSRPADFATFVQAAARRYPQVRHWMIWGEPTKALNFQPLVPDGGRRLRGAGLRPPRLYARILDSSYAALKRANKRNVVIGGNTFTVGTVRPRNWIRALRLPNGKPPRMDLYGHNPFSVRRPGLKRAPLGNGYADFSDLDELYRWVQRNLRRRGTKKLRLFLSEFSIPTDHPNHEFNFYVRQETQASWLAAAMRIVRRSPWIYTLGYLALTDDDLRPDGQQVERGLIDRQGQRKPGYYSFKRG